MILWSIVTSTEYPPLVPESNHILDGCPHSPREGHDFDPATVSMWYRGPFPGPPHRARHAGHTPDSSRGPLIRHFSDGDKTHFRGHKSIVGDARVRASISPHFRSRVIPVESVEGNIMPGSPFRQA